MKIAISIVQLILFVAISPLLSGLISKAKNNIRMRKGQSVFQPYYNLVKLFSKEDVVSQAASWIFRAAPFIVFSAMLTAAILVFAPESGFVPRMGDLLVLIFVFALSRFFMALAGLDAGSSFGGMGSSREMFICGLVEPVFCLVVFSIFLQFGSTGVSVFGSFHPVSACSIIGALALFMVTLAETSRIPVDNQETHLELTMVHEAMVLEYSGKPLAFMELAAHIKQMILFFLTAQLVFPVDINAFWGVWYWARIMIIIFIISLVEVSVAKMRLFRVADFLGFAFVLAVIAVICAVLGV